MVRFCTEPVRWSGTCRSVSMGCAAEGDVEPVSTFLTLSQLFLQSSPSRSSGFTGSISEDMEPQGDGILATGECKLTAGMSSLGVEVFDGVDGESKVAELLPLLKLLVETLNWPESSGVLGECSSLDEEAAPGVEEAAGSKGFCRRLASGR